MAYRYCIAYVAGWSACGTNAQTCSNLEVQPALLKPCQTGKIADVLFLFKSESFCLDARVVMKMKRLAKGQNVGGYWTIFITYRCRCVGINTYIHALPRREIIMIDCITSKPKTFCWQTHLLKRIDLDMQSKNRLM